MTEPVRVRFAPSPTGSLHVGSARTGIANFLFARHHGGTFLLRIEDTDVARSREEWIQGIQDDLRWLGVDWDEEPVRQSTRFDAYVNAANQLIEAGLAYEAFETPEELDVINDERKAKGLPPGYDGRARNLDPAERERLRAENRPRVVRFRTPDDGHSTFHDEIRGDITVDWSTIGDYVILRSDGTPTFFLANAVDDLDMKITHAIRGEDLIDTTHRIQAVITALGGEPPKYAHLPLILSPDRSKLSKRHGSVSLDEFRHEGYLPEALVNYVALLGWSPADGREILSMADLISEYDLDRATHTAAVFDYAKLGWMNGEYIRAKELDQIAPIARELAAQRFGDRVDDELFVGALPLGKERATTLGALVDQMDFLFLPDDDFTIAAASWEKVVATDRVGEILDAAIAHLEVCDWTPEAIDLRPVIDALDIKVRKAMPALYAAVEGRHAGLPLFDSIQLLGRERAIARLQAARDRVGAG
ncbi:MAG: glutamate--tRNA ligase [Acidimicrobiia bacterium]